MYFKIEKKVNSDFYFFGFFNKFGKIETAIDVQDETFLYKNINKKFYLSQEELNILNNLEVYLSRVESLNVLASYKFKQSYAYFDEELMQEVSEFTIDSINAFDFGYIYYRDQRILTVCLKKEEVLFLVLLEETEFNSKYNLLITSAINFQSFQMNIHHEAIRRVRKYLKITGVEFALLLGFVGANKTIKTQIRRYETGEKIPNRSAQQIIKYIKLNGSNNNFVKYLFKNLKIM